MGEILDAVRDREQAQRMARRVAPDIRLFSFPQGRALEQGGILAEPVLEFVVGCEDSQKWIDNENDTGAGRLVVDADYPSAKWLMDVQRRESSGLTQDVLVAVDYAGRRWSGFLTECAAHTDDLGATKVTATFQSDYEQFKARDLWATPPTPAGFQPIKEFMLLGPPHWALGTALKMNLQRAHGYPAGVGFLDPLADGGADYRRWPIVLAPLSHSAAAADGLPTAIVMSRFDSFADVAAPILEDAGLSLRWRRYLPGDELPWTGARLRYGTLVVWFEDNSSSIASDTSGSFVGGIVQLVETMASAVVEGIGAGVLPIENTVGQPKNPPTIPQYREPGYLGTDPRAPYVLYSADSPGIVSIDSKVTLAKYHRFTAGGHSMPGVNEMIEAGTNFAAAAVAAIPVAPIPDVGPTLNALLKPFYSDVFLAFMTVYLRNRGEYMSDFAPYEHFVPGADKAYTLSATMVMRQAMLASSRMWTFDAEIMDGTPWWIGARGYGHYDLGDRILIEDDVTRNIIAERVRTLTLKAERGEPPAFSVKLGTKDPQDAFGRVVKQIKSLMEGLKQLGVF